MKAKTLNLEDYINDNRNRVEECLKNLIPESQVAYRELFTMARYSLLAPAKRLRPILALAVAESLSAPSIPLSIPCALELIHTYSIIHDDLPCMDDDDERRGQPSLHKAYDEAKALLTGDYLLTKAFEVIASESSITAEQKVALTLSLSKNCGANGMIGGQFLDISEVGKEINVDTLRIIHLNKTAAPFIAAVEFGGILANAPQGTLESLKLFATQIGLGFQIIDDILDVEGESQETGKPTGSDASKDKYTYVNVMGVAQAREAAEYLYQNAMAALDMIPGDTSLIKNIASMMIHRNK